MKTPLLTEKLVTGLYIRTVKHKYQHPEHKWISNQLIENLNSVHKCGERSHVIQSIALI